nr:CoA transferase [Rhizobium sp. Q54]
MSRESTVVALHADSEAAKPTSEERIAASRARIKRSLSEPMTSDDVLNPNAILDGLLRSLGFEDNPSGGKVTFKGKDPILKSPWPLATMGGVALMAKAVAAATVWRDRTGETQDLLLDLRKAPRRLCPFYERKWELLNGYPPIGQHDPTNPFWPQNLYPTKDGRWIQLYNIYPKAKTKALAFLNCPDNYRAISQVTRNWNSFALEEIANAQGMQATVIRSVDEFLELEQFEHLAGQPLVEITKIGESDPVPFPDSPKTPLDGIRALGLGHVIAGPGVGRALAFHGADVLNIWRPEDFEIDNMYATSSVGLRSSTIEFGNREGMSRLRELVKGTDIFFANRRPGYLTHFHLTAEELAEINPGLVHIEMSLYGNTGPWAGRVGYDQNAGGVSGIFVREGTFERPSLTEIFVVNDYAMAWLSFVAATVALRRRAKEGGSYRIRISLVRLSIWLLEMGIFDKSYARAIGHSDGDHEFLAPDLFTVETPLGHYQGVTDQVEMSKTPGSYQFPLVPRGSSRPEWLPRG